MKILIAFLSFINFSYALDFTIFPVTTNPAFNYFFSFPVWILILVLPVFLVFFIIRYFK